MNKINHGLVLYLKLDNVNKNKVLDSSQAQITGTVKDATLVKDQTFGYCLSFNGTVSNYVEISINKDNEALKIQGAITIAAWFYIAAEGSSKKIRIVNTAAQISSDKHWNYGLSYLYNQSSSELEFIHYSNQGHLYSLTVKLPPEEKLQKDKWYHLTGVADAKYSQIYLDGKLVISSQENQKHRNTIRYDKYQSSSNLRIGSDSTDNENFSPHNGKIANVRIYNRALSENEINEVRKIEAEPKSPKSLGIVPDIITPLLYRKSHPIDFNLFNEDNDYVLYISDDPSKQHILNLELKNSSTQAIRFLYSNSHQGQASKDNYHFALVFGSGTLSDKTLETLTLTINKATVLKQPEEWDVAISQESQENGQKARVCLYFLYKGDNKVLKPAEIRRITLHNMSAVAGSGARGTQVELKLNQLAYVDADASSKITGSRLQKLHIANHVGRKNIPLHVGFVGSNRILNDGSSNSEPQLNLRITNISKETISLEGGSFILSFDLGDQDWAIATGAQFKPIIEAKANNQRIEIKNPASGQGVSPEWIIEKQITKLEYNQYIDIAISRIITSKPSGYTNLYIKYENIPGYCDGQFVCVIEKAPLLFSGNNVGIGTRSPKNKLDVAGGMVIGPTYSGNYLAPTDPQACPNGLLVEGKVGIGTKNPISSLSISNNYTQQTNKAGVLGEITFIGCNRGNKASASIKAESPSWDDQSHLIFMTSSDAGGAKERMRITNNGNIVIGAKTPSPSAKLEINGGDILGLQVNGSSATNKIETKEVMRLVRPASSEQNANSVGFHVGSFLHTDYTVGNSQLDILLANLADESNNWGNLPNVPVMSLRANGNVGIGTTEPSATLDVYGDFHIKHEKPMVYVTYEQTKDIKPPFQTIYPVEKWIAIIAGYNVSDQANVLKGILAGIELMAVAGTNGKWQINCDLKSTENQKWKVQVLFIKRELVCEKMSNEDCKVFTPLSP